MVKIGEALCRLAAEVVNVNNVTTTGENTFCFQDEKNVTKSFSGQCCFHEPSGPDLGSKNVEFSFSINEETQYV